MYQWEAAIAALFLEGPGWHSDYSVTTRVMELGLVHTRGKTFQKSVNMYLNRYGAGHVEHYGRHFDRTGLYRIRNHPDSIAWCESLIKKHPHKFKVQYPQYFKVSEPPSRTAEKLPVVKPATPVSVVNNNNRDNPKTDNAKRAGKRRQPDPLLRCKVEQAAIEMTTAHFVGQGFTVKPQAKDNLGWDLFATCGTRELRLEVKGLSGSKLCVELTPNEYAQMKKWKGSYCVCVVTNALSDPRLALFGYIQESDAWQDDDRKRTLHIKEIVAARCSSE